MQALEDIVLTGLTEEPAIILPFTGIQSPPEEFGALMAEESPEQFLLLLLAPLSDPPGVVRRRIDPRWSLADGVSLAPGGWSLRLFWRGASC